MNNRLNLTWFDSNLNYGGFRGKNWGDALNPVLVEKISGKKVNYVPKDDLVSVKYLAIGSILSYASENTIVWGSGFIASNDKLIHKPKEIFSVRGPLTRKKVIEQGFSCPDVYGDPALLYPRYFNPEVDKKYRIGIIPHYVDNQSEWLDNYRNSDEILIIDILSDINDFVTKIKSCDFVVSSSLHGLVACDSYGIPCSWIKLSEKIVGSDFKFNDYFMSIGQGMKKPYLVDNSTIIDDIVNDHNFYDINIDLDRLLDNCPFYNKHQISNATSYNRYPEIFSHISSIINNCNVLSYGCSVGQEVESLNALYFDNSKIFGYDIDKKAISQARKFDYTTKNNQIYFLENLVGEFDVIFVMSVLCRWPSTYNVENCNDFYTFDSFYDEICKIDKVLKVGGYLVLYNTNYLFEQTNLFDKYLSVDFVFESGFVTKYNQDGTKHLQSHNSVIYQKIG